MDQIQIIYGRPAAACSPTLTPLPIPSFIISSSLSSSAILSARLISSSLFSLNVRSLVIRLNLSVASLIKAQVTALTFLLPSRITFGQDSEGMVRDSMCLGGSSSFALLDVLDSCHKFHLSMMLQVTYLRFLSVGVSAGCLGALGWDGVLLSNVQSRGSPSLRRTLRNRILIWVLCVRYRYWFWAPWTAWSWCGPGVRVSSKILSPTVCVFRSRQLCTRNVVICSTSCTQILTENFVLSSLLSPLCIFFVVSTKSLIWSYNCSL